MNTPTPHPYAHILRAIAEGTTIQIRRIADEDSWFDLPSNDVLSMIADGTYKQQGLRVKPLIINGHHVTEPERKPPPHGAAYWLADIVSSDLSDMSEFTWQGNAVDHQWLDRGLIHLTKEAALIHAKALISLTAAPAAPAA